MVADVVFYSEVNLLLTLYKKISGLYNDVCVSHLQRYCLILGKGYVLLIQVD